MLAGEISAMSHHGEDDHGERRARADRGGNGARSASAEAEGNAIHLMVFDHKPEVWANQVKRQRFMKRNEHLVSRVMHPLVCKKTKSVLFL